MKIKAKLSTQKTTFTLEKFRWQDYAYFLATICLGMLTFNGAGWFITAWFTLAFCLSTKKIYDVCQGKDLEGVRFFLQKADISHKREKYSEARVFYTKAIAAGSGIKNNPILYPAFVFRAHASLILNDHEAAIKDCTSAIEIDASQSQGYYLRSLAKFQRKSNLEDFEKDLQKAIELGDQRAVELLNSLSKEKTEFTLLEPADDLAEWRTAQAILSRNAAYVQTYEKYIELLGSSDGTEEFRRLKNQLYNEYFEQIKVSSKYKDAYMLFRLRNLTYACMAINMHGQRNDDEVAFKQYFLHPIFDTTDTKLREILSKEEIQKQFNRANELEQYIVYSCSIYCNKLLNLIDGGSREERDNGESYDKFLEIQLSLEQQKKFDEIYVVREAMLWTIASTNVDLVTSTEDSDAFEIRAFNLLSKTNQHKSDYGNGPYRKDDIIKAVMKRRKWSNQLALKTDSISSSKHQEKLSAMTDEQITAEAIGKEPSLVMREFLNRWGQSSQVRYGIDDLRQAVINDYAYLCYQDGGTQPDETSLEEYKKNVHEMSVDELVSETSVIETSEFKIDELIDYIELWLKFSEYAAYDYEKTSEGGTVLSEV